MLIICGYAHLSQTAFLKQKLLSKYDMLLRVPSLLSIEILIIVHCLLIESKTMDQRCRVCRWVNFFIFFKLFLSFN